MAVKDMAGGEDELESVDAEPLDLTPRAAHSTSGGGKAKFVYVGLGAIVVLLGFLVANTLSKATTFFYNVDEVIAKQSSLQGERIRMQGNVVDGSVRNTDDGVSFVLRFKGQEIPVDHVGDPPELFGPKIPVVLEGSLKGNTFHSDQILVRHDASYDEKNQDRVKDAKNDAEQGATGARGGTAPQGGATG